MRVPLVRGVARDASLRGALTESAGPRVFDTRADCIQGVIHAAAAVLLVTELPVAVAVSATVPGAFDSVLAPALACDLVCKPSSWVIVGAVPAIDG